MSFVESKLGKDLTKEEIKVINKYKAQEFGTKPLDEEDNSKYRKHVFFFVKSEKGKIVSFGRLARFIMEFKSRKYNIYGICTIVSVIKKKGFGKKLIKAMKEFVLQTDKTCIGFCDPNLSLFYKKCGLSILPQQARRFVKGGDSIKADSCRDDVIYQEGKDSLIRKIKRNPDELVLLPTNRW